MTIQQPAPEMDEKFHPLYLFLQSHMTATHADLVIHFLHPILTNVEANDKLVAIIEDLR